MAKSNSNGGYGKPPKKNQFKPGKSGNPKGRTKESKNFDKILEELFQKKIVIKENGEERKVTIKVALTQKLLVKALYEGDLKAMELLLKHIDRLDTKAAEKMLLEEKTKNNGKSREERFLEFQERLKGLNLGSLDKCYRDANVDTQEDDQDKSA